MKYRRRRTFALLLLIALIWGVWSGISALGTLFGGGAQQAKAGDVCAAGAVQVKAHVGNGTTDATQFFQGEEVKIWYDIVNVGNVPCKFNLGTKETYFKITSGSETIWDSRMCDRSKDQDLEVSLEPNVPKLSAPSVWKQVYSSNSGCGDGQNPVPTGGASYHLSVSVNNVVSTNDPQFSLN